MENPKGSNFTSGGTTSIVSRNRFSQVERLDLVGLCWTVSLGHVKSTLVTGFVRSLRDLETLKGLEIICIAQAHPQ